MWQAEILFRQGSWCRRFDDEDDARTWIQARNKAEKKTVNPPRDIRLMFEPPDVLPLPEPVVPARNADELLTDEEFWK